jgi:hypothetical protein
LLRKKLLPYSPGMVLASGHVILIFIRRERGSSGTHDDADDGGQSGPSGTDAGDAHFDPQHFGRCCGAEVLLGAGSVLDGFELLFGGADRCFAYVVARRIKSGAVRI